jgi:hypothetical protein
VAGIARRVVATVGAAAAFSFGGYATATTDNELGTVAAFVTGLFFTVVAFTGRVPRIKHGEWEIDPVSVAVVMKQRATAAAQEAVEKGAEPRAVAEAVAEASAATARDVDTLLDLDPDRHFGANLLRNMLFTSQGGAPKAGRPEHPDVFRGNKSYRLDPDVRDEKTDGQPPPS